MSDDWDDITDPMNLVAGWAAWSCAHCGEDGERADLVRGRCPVCTNAVDVD